VVRRRAATLSFPFAPEKHLGFRVPFSNGLTVTVGAGIALSKVLLFYRLLSRVVSSSD
jgi:hypothetical protein